MRNSVSVLTVLVSLFISACQSTYEPPKSFQLGGTSHWDIENLSSDSLSIEITNYMHVPAVEEQFDTLIGAGDTFRVDLVSQARDYFYITLNDKEFRLFQAPDSRQHLIYKEEGQLEFHGHFVSINNYRSSLESMGDFLPRMRWYQGTGSVDDLIAGNDSITADQKQALDSFPDLPEWYKTFELERLDYLNADHKLGTLVYRARFSGKKDSIESGLLEEVTKDLKLINSEFTGVEAYMRFLMSYLSHKRDPQFIKPIPSSKKDWMKYASRIKASIEEKLVDNELRDVYFAAYLTKMMENRRHVLREEWFEDFHDPRFATIVKAQLEAKPILAAGESLPFFRLVDKDSTFYEPADLRGKILLINFWASWCKGCFSEFEHENKLVEEFSNEPVQIVNICIETEKEKWRRVVDEYGMKPLNLYANENWSDIITERFGITGLPRSALVDSDGIIIQNNCARPSSGVEEFIWKALDDLPGEPAISD